MNTSNFTESSGGTFPSANYNVPEIISDVLGNGLVIIQICNPNYATCIAGNNYGLGWSSTPLERTVLLFFYGSFTSLDTFPSDIANVLQVTIIMPTSVVSLL